MKPDVHQFRFTMKLPMLHYIDLMSIEESVNVKGGSVVFLFGNGG